MKKIRNKFNFFNKETSFVFHSMDKIVDNKIKKNIKRYGYKKFDVFKILLNGNIIPTSSVVVKKKVLLEVNI